MSKYTVRTRGPESNHWKEWDAEVWAAELTFLTKQLTDFIRSPYPADAVRALQFAHAVEALAHSYYVLHHETSTLQEAKDAAIQLLLTATDDEDFELLKDDVLVSLE